VGEEQERETMRHGLLQAAALEVLRDAGHPMKRKDVIEQIPTRIKLTEYEKTELPTNGRQRWENSVGWGSAHFVAADWIVKDSGLWSITEKGVDALDRYRPEDIGRIAKEIYNDQYRAAKTHAWLVRGNNVDGHDLVPDWLSDGVVTLSATYLRPVESSTNPYVSA